MVEAELRDKTNRKIDLDTALRGGKGWTTLAMMNYGGFSVYDWLAAANAVRSARWRVRDCVPVTYRLFDCVPIYAEARRLQKETGVLHDVDHIIGIRDGGKHTASNLQVMTHSENVKKRDREIAQRKLKQTRED